MKKISEAHKGRKWPEWFGKRVSEAKTGKIQRRNQIKNGGTSSYFGVCFAKGKNRWLARYNLYKKTVYIGTFKTEMEAALAYDAAVKNLDNYPLNFPEMEKA